MLVCDCVRAERHHQALFQHGVLPALMDNLQLDREKSVLEAIVAALTHLAVQGESGTQPGHCALRAVIMLALRLHLGHSLPLRH
jgi:hypothetical protein